MLRLYQAIGAIQQRVDRREAGDMSSASRQEIVETLLHIAPYAGFPAAWEGLAQADQVFRELDGPKGVCSSE